MGNEEKLISADELAKNASTKIVDAVRAGTTPTITLESSPGSVQIASISRGTEIRNYLTETIKTPGRIPEVVVSGSFSAEVFEFSTAPERLSVQGEMIAPANSSIWNTSEITAKGGLTITGRISNIPHNTLDKITNLDAGNRGISIDGKQYDSLDAARTALHEQGSGGQHAQKAVAEETAFEEKIRKTLGVKEVEIETRRDHSRERTDPTPRKRVELSIKKGADPINSNAAAQVAGMLKERFPGKSIRVTVGSHYVDGTRSWVNSIEKTEKKFDRRPTTVTNEKGAASVNKIPGAAEASRTSPLPSESSEKPAEPTKGTTKSSPLPPTRTKLSTGMKLAAGGAIAGLPVGLEVYEDIKNPTKPESVGMNVSEDVARGGANIIVASECAAVAMASVAPVAAGMSASIVGIPAGILLEAGAGLIGGGVCYVASDELIKHANTAVSGKDYGELAPNAPEEAKTQAPDNGKTSQR